MDNGRATEEPKKAYVYKTPAEREREYKKWEQKEKERPLLDAFDRQ